ncbi:MAG TPA: hypothetical protein VKY89_17185 [Thermoanaerobaculia bacterium]|jgi:hypothetical protein|nr:hypothetical protein [Thermoanaerobaculia bacterium]
MQKKTKKLKLNRDTLRSLAAVSLEKAGGAVNTQPYCSARCTAYVTCPQTCVNTCDPNVGTCFFCGGL